MTMVIVDSKIIDNADTADEKGFDGKENVGDQNSFGFHTKLPTSPCYAVVEERFLESSETRKHVPHRFGNR